MGGHGINYEGVGGISPSYREEDHEEDGPVRWGVSLVIYPGRRGCICSGDVVNAGICMEAAGNNCIIYSDMINL